MHDLDFMMAACKMNDSEKKALVDVFNKQVDVEVDSTPNTPKRAAVDKENKSAKTPINDENLTKVEAQSKTSTAKVKDNNNVLNEEKQDVKKVSKDKKGKCSKDTGDVKVAKDLYDVKVMKDNIDLDEKPKDKKETKQQKALKEPTSDQKPKDKKETKQQK